jgi:predicted alpha/beta-hydrolase family hydrolase
MAAAEDGNLADGLVFLSYPLHPPRRPSELRTAHFPGIVKPCLFVHGTRDPFGSPEEMTEALKAISAPIELYLVDRAGHDLNKPVGSVASVVEKLMAWMAILL